jgi:hypothetical protein
MMKPFPLLAFYAGVYLYTTPDFHDYWVERGIYFEEGDILYKNYEEVVKRFHNI